MCPAAAERSIHRARLKIANPMFTPEKFLTQRCRSRTRAPDGPAKLRAASVRMQSAPRASLAHGPPRSWVTAPPRYFSSAPGPRAATVLVHHAETLTQPISAESEHGPTAIRPPPQRP
jgi:hypothetical protein